MSEPARPLAGRRIVVTRRPRQSTTLGSRLEALGAEVVEVPAIEIAPPDDPGPLDRALSALDRYDWIAFTSTNAVDAVRARLLALGRSLPPTLQVATVGRSTTAAVAAAFPGVPVRLEPAADFRAGGLLKAFAGLPSPARMVLLPVSDRARPELADGLRRLGAHVENSIGYTVLAPSTLTACLEEAFARRIDLFMFASPSAVQSVEGVLGARATHLPVVAIGPTTAEAAETAGMDVLAVASPSTADGLVDAAVRALSGLSRSEPSP